MKQLLTSSLNALGLAWWVEITTANPTCLYYFGPFNGPDEAKDSEPGYVEDLQTEGAVEINTAIKRCKPKELTVFDENEPVIQPSAA